MRRHDPLIIGGGPAGCAAAIALAGGGATPVIVERHATIGDAICGGFLSWHTLTSLTRLGVDPADLRGHPVDRVRIFAGDRSAEARLPAGAIGVSRRRLDTVLRARAQAAGAGLEIAHIRDADARDAESRFLATGKHDLRGLARPKMADDPALGLRVRLSRHPGLTRLTGRAIELHLFDRGYAGLVLQEDGSANLCLALRKSRLTEAGGQPAALLRAIATEVPALGDRLAFADALPPADAIAAVPYGWRATTGTPGLFRLGDQAACIPSLAGEGIGIALASGISAADAWLKDGLAAAPEWQRSFARRAARPVTIATWLWHRSEVPWSAALATRALRIAPGMARALAQATRIGD